MSDLWTWIASRRAGDNPRGDFIRDTRELLAANVDPGARIDSACDEAIRQYERLERQYRRIL